MVVFNKINEELNTEEEMSKEAKSMNDSEYPHPAPHNYIRSKEILRLVLKENKHLFKSYVINPTEEVLQELFPELARSIENLRFKKKYLEVVRRRLASRRIGQVEPGLAGFSYFSQESFLPNYGKDFWVQHSLKIKEIYQTAN